MTTELRSEVPVEFAELHRRYFDDVRRFVARRVDDEYLAEDIAQETFLNAYRSRASYDPARPAWPWLSTIARNLVINSHRDAHRRPVTGVELDEAEREPDTGIDVDPEIALLGSVRRDAIQQSFATLSPRQRRVLQLRCVDGQSYDEIAQAEALTIDALKSLLKRARQAFRSNYIKLAGESEVPSVIWVLRSRFRSAAFRVRTLFRMDASTVAGIGQVATQIVLAACLTGALLVAPSTVMQGQPIPTGDAHRQTPSAVPNSIQSAHVATTASTDVAPEHGSLVGVDIDRSMSDRRTVHLSADDEVRDRRSDTTVDVPCLSIVATCMIADRLVQR